MVRIIEEFQEGRHSMKRRYKEKSAAKEEHCNTIENIYNEPDMIIDDDFFPFFW